MPRRLQRAWGSVRRFLDTGNFIRFLVALVLAFALWAWVTYENDPEITRTLNGVPVTLSNLPDDVEIVGEVPTVDIQVQGPQSVVSPMERESVQAIVDVDGINEPGEYEFDVEVETPPNVRVRNVSPETVVIEIDRISTRTGIPVETVDPDDVPTNFRVQDITVEPETVTITGPLRSIQDVDAARVQVQIDGRTSSFSDTLEPTLVNSEGEEVMGVQIEPSEVTVSVTLEVRGQVRKVIPVIVGDNELAPGHELVRTTVLPSDEVVVDGPEEELSNIFFVTTVPVDISGWSESQIVRDVAIDKSRLPDSVTVETETVHVSVEIRQEAYQREVSDIPITTMNAAPGTNVMLGTSTATVVLEGSRAAIDEVQPEDITVFVNLDGAEPGRYTRDLRVIVPPQVQYREVIPRSIEVEVQAEEVEEPEQSS